MNIRIGNCAIRALLVTPIVMSLPTEMIFFDKRQCVVV